MRSAILTTAALALAVGLAGCGSSDPVVTAPDLAVVSPLTWARCAMDPGADEPEQRPAADFFSTDAPHDGDLVPSDPVAAAICPFSFGGGSTSGGPVHLSGRSLASLVKELNAADRYDGTESCTAQAGWQVRIVFRYADDRVLPVVVSANGCGYADNGAQQRIGLGPWLETWQHKLGRRLAPAP